MSAKFSLARFYKPLYLLLSCAVIICVAIYIFSNPEKLRGNFHFPGTKISFTLEDIKDLFTVLGIILIPAGWVYNEQQQRALDQYARKEQKYQVILRSADALIYEDFRHPETRQLIYKFIKEFQVSYLYVPDNVIRAGHEFLKCFEELMEEPEDALSQELKETLATDIIEEQINILENQSKPDLPKARHPLYEEYLSQRQKELYEEFRDKIYPEFVRAIRRDMMAKRTSLSNDEYIVRIPSRIKIARHFKFVGRKVAHLILMLAEAKKYEDTEKLSAILARLIKCLKPNFQDINYVIEKNFKIVIIIGEKRHNIISFLDRLSINEVLGFEKAIEIKQILEVV